MASSTENSDETFPSADIAAELNPGNNTEVQVDPISSEVAASKEIKEEATDKQKKKQIEKKEYLDKLKSAIIISSIVVALAGAAFAITKKLKEK
ncbi:transmembrane protein, putative [Medicago truncatula]|uniref:Transmembrane protein, putative n=1 Tax=Medicago truncatula TaxID=3880 RepID=A0A072VK59_MEDTR|nr:transmembrane protein, putative [Medicago truncatula]